MEVNCEEAVLLGKEMPSFLLFYILRNKAKSRGSKYPKQTLIKYLIIHSRRSIKSLIININKYNIRMA